MVDIAICGAPAWRRRSEGLGECGQPGTLPPWRPALTARGLAGDAGPYGLARG